MEFVLAASNSAPPSIHPGWVVGGVTLLIAVVVFIFKAGDWYGKVNTDRSNFREFMDEVRTDIKKILGYVGPEAIVGSSPLRLTDLGNKIAKEVDAESWTEELLLKVSGEAENKSPYEIQEFCFQYAQELVPTPEQRLALHRTAYDNGVETLTVRRVLAIVLRDKLLQHTNQQAS